MNGVRVDIFVYLLSILLVVQIVLRESRGARKPVKNGIVCDVYLLLEELKQSWIIINDNLIISKRIARWGNPYVSSIQVAET